MVSVLQLARYKRTDKVYWIAMESLLDEPTIGDNDVWLFGEKVHPRVPFQRHAYHWPYRRQLPKLSANGFVMMTEVLVCRPTVETFTVSSITHCPNTGEFLYFSDEAEDWAPEDCLFPTYDAADAERKRILKLVQEWLSRQLAE